MGFHELACELIQPIWWSDPGPFFATGDDASHSRHLHREAFCYMLSNNTVQRNQGQHPGRDLLALDSFFSFLLRRANLPPPAAPEGAADDACARLPFCLRAIRDVAPASVLDASARPERWGMMIRAIRPDAIGEDGAPAPRLLAFVAPGMPPIEPLQLSCYDQVLERDLAPLAQDKAGVDLVLLDDLHLRRDPATAGTMLDAALGSAGYVLLSAELDSGPGTPGVLDVLRRSPVRSEIRPAADGRRFASALLSATDPRALRPDHASQHVFERAYRSNLAAGDESVSGPGSGAVQTAEIRARLPVLLETLCIRSLLDASCGDFNWMRTVELGVHHYIGVDIVPDLIAANAARYGDARRSFLCLDILCDALPRADAILCRDCLVHYPFEDIVTALRDFGRSGAIYLITTTFTGARENTQIRTGEWRPLNLQSPPFGFPPPLRVVMERCTEGGGRYTDKSLGVWRLADLPLAWG